MVAKGCLTLWIYGWLENIQWKIITWTRRFLQPLKYGNMEDITDSDYTHGKRVCKDFEIKNVEAYHDLYLQCDTLLLAHAYENFWFMCNKIYERDAARFLSAPGLAWQVALKSTKVKLDRLTDMDLLLMVQKVVREGMCHSI